MNDEIIQVIRADENNKLSLGYLIDIGNKTIICSTYEQAKTFLNNPDTFHELFVKKLKEEIRMYRKNRKKQKQA